MINLKQYTESELQRAREYAAQGQINLAEAIERGDKMFALHVTEQQKQERAKTARKVAADIIAGKADGNFSTQQRMHYYLTGESVALLPKY